MVNTAKIKAEVKEVVAEAESAASGLMGIVTPRWNQFVTKWKTYTLRKKLITGLFIIGIGVACWWCSVDVMRLAVGSYRSAYAYGHGQGVTLAEVQASIKTSTKDLASKKEVEDLKTKLQAMSDDVKSIDDKLDSSSSRSSVAPKKKKVSVKSSSASSWFSFN